MFSSWVTLGDLLNLSDIWFLPDQMYVMILPFQVSRYGQEGRDGGQREIPIC